MMADIFLYKISCIFPQIKLTISDVILFITFLAILWYAWETNRLKKATVTQTGLLLRPLVIIDKESTHNFSFKNISQSPALNIGIETVESDLFYMKFNSIFALKLGDTIQLHDEPDILYKNEDVKKKLNDIIKTQVGYIRKPDLYFPFFKREIAELLSSYLLKIIYTNLKEDIFYSNVRVDCVNESYIVESTGELTKKPPEKIELNKKISRFIKSYEHDRNSLEYIIQILNNIDKIKTPLSEKKEECVKRFAKEIEENAKNISYSEYNDIKNMIIEYSAKRNEIYRGISDKEFDRLFKKQKRPDLPEPIFLKEKIEDILNSTLIPLAEF
ncbi:MAG: hypothetical protein JXB26_18530 [Candidatus Aminicenantes bacterium]|nr:hypothetical protein [Candidatus Aminicenantes bacterium]